MAIVKRHSEVVRFQISDYLTGDSYTCSTFDEVLQVLSDFTHWHFKLVKIRVVKNITGCMTNFAVPMDYDDLQEMLALKR